MRCIGRSETEHSVNLWQDLTPLTGVSVRRQRGAHDGLRQMQLFPQQRHGGLSSLLARENRLVARGKVAALDRKSVV